MTTNDEWHVARATDQASWPELDKLVLVWQPGRTITSITETHLYEVRQLKYDGESTWWASLDDIDDYLTEDFFEEDEPEPGIVYWHELPALPQV